MDKTVFKMLRNWGGDAHNKMVHRHAAAASDFSMLDSNSILILILRSNIEMVFCIFRV